METKQILDKLFGKPKNDKELLSNCKKVDTSIFYICGLCVAVNGFIGIYYSLLYNQLILFPLILVASTFIMFELYKQYSHKFNIRIQNRIATSG